jgi:hypothetical protein
MTSEQDKELHHYVMKIEPGKYEVTVNLVTSVSTTANASFDKFVGVFTKRISDKAAEVFGDHEATTIDKST